MSPQSGRRRLLGRLYCLALLSIAVWFGGPALPVRAANGCTELLADGGFEAGGAWQLGQTPLTPQYVTYAKHSGNRSLLLGIASGGNVKSFSSARQTVTIPLGSGPVTLSFWVYAMATGAPTTDYMEVALLSADGSTIVDKPWYSRNDSQTWNQMTFDLSRWRGYTLQVYFNVYNDGLGGTAGMFLDDVSLSVCPPNTATVTPTATPTPSVLPPTATPTPTPSLTPIVVTATYTPWVVTATYTPWVVTATYTPWIVTATFTPTPGPPPTQTPIVVTPTWTPGLPPSPTGTVPTSMPTPSDCIDLVYNAGFEQELAGWYLPGNKLPAQVVVTPAHAGNRSLRLGTQDQNLNSYSSVRQPMTIPTGYAQVTLEFWTWTWAESLSGSDRQEAWFLASDGSLLTRWWRALANEQAWVQHRFPATVYAGESVILYFNVFNDGTGGRTAMFLDDVHLWACGWLGGPNATVMSGSGQAPSTSSGQAPSTGSGQVPSAGAVIVIPSGTPKPAGQAASPGGQGAGMTVVIVPSTILPGHGSGQVPSSTSPGTGSVVQRSGEAVPPPLTPVPGATSLVLPTREPRPTAMLVQVGAQEAAPAPPIDLLGWVPESLPRAGVVTGGVVLLVTVALIARHRWRR